MIPNTRNSRSILVFEADTLKLHIVSIVLGSMGNMQVRACHSLSEAIHTIKNELPDVMLIDVNINQSGWRDAQFLRAQVGSETVPCILLIDEAQESYFNQLDCPWVIGRIIKPIKPLTLAEDILALLECE